MTLMRKLSGLIYRDVWPHLKMMVRPKKFLGQHFLTDQQVARKIVDAFEPAGACVVEIGPGTGALTRHLVTRNLHPWLVEVDRESVAWLLNEYSPEQATVMQADFLEVGLQNLPPGKVAVIGNFPYNISSQIFFKVLENRDRVDLVVGMIQKEVAQRIAAPPGSRTYGILSVFLQAWYDIRFLFHVPPGVFNPPPKVMSSVIRLQRNSVRELGCDEGLFFTIVKRAFQNRRKTLRNALKDLNLPSAIYGLELMDKRAEQLSVRDFVGLVNHVTSS